MRLTDVISSLSSNWLKMFILIIVLYLTTLTDHSLSTSSTLSFTPSTTTNLTHLAVDPLTGTVYVGAVNHLYQLDSHLTTVVDVNTGPVQDDKNCMAFDRETGEPSCQTLNLVSSDNYNQVIEPSTATLFVYFILYYTVY